MGFLINFLVTFAFIIAELSFFPHFKIFNVTPLIVIFFVICLAYFRKGREPFLLASFSGVFLDFNSAYPFGTYLVFLLILVTVIKIFFLPEII